MDTARTSDGGSDRDDDLPFRDRIGMTPPSFTVRLSVDTRALAALRIALGTIILLDLGFRAADLGLFYTGSGLYPIGVHEATYGQAGTLSLYAISDALWVQTCLFLVAGGFAFAFLVGYRTRFVGAVSLVFLVSLHVRNPAVLNGGDRLLWILLLVGLLTPLGERWSVDSLRRSATARESVLSVGTVALLTQPLVAFASNAIRKARGEYWLAGEALEVALSNPVMTRPTADPLLSLSPLVTGLNYAWIALLVGSVPLLLGASGRFRTLVVSAYLAAFAGMAVTMVVGLFPFVLAASVLPFLPASAWDALERRLPTRRIGRWTRFPAFSSGRSSEKRFQFGGRSPLADARPFEPRSIGALRRTLLSAAAVAVLVWMLAFAGFGLLGATPPAPLDADVLDQQEWGLYAPDPSESYDRYVTEAELENGDRIDALDGGSVDPDRPPDAAPTGASARHRSFAQTIAASGQGTVDPTLADHYVEWACGRASTHADSVERVTVVRLRQSGLSDGSEPSTRSTVVESPCR